MWNPHKNHGFHDPKGPMIWMTGGTAGQVGDQQISWGINLKTTMKKLETH